MLVIDSATAIRAAAAELSSARGDRSPMLIACPVFPRKEEALTATSLTGTCHFPTIWSRVVNPPTLRSPIVTRNFLLATAGNCKTLLIASSNTIVS